MNSTKLLSSFTVLFMFSCSTKTNTRNIQNDLTSNFTATNQNIIFKTDFSRGLKKLKPSRKTEINNYNFLTYADKDNLELLLRENRASFVVFGIVSDDYSDFEKKYGISVRTENCVIASGISQTAILNNQLIAEHLNQKFTKAWRDDLKIVPFGLH